MTEWILDLCPEIAPWQAEIISEHVNELIEKERDDTVCCLEFHGCEDAIGYLNWRWRNRARSDV